LPAALDRWRRRLLHSVAAEKRNGYVRADLRPDGKAILVHSASKGMELIDAPTGKSIRVLAPASPDHTLHDALFSPDGRWLVTAVYKSSTRSSNYQLWNGGL
jgi:hypothetical protein